MDEQKQIIEQAKEQALKVIDLATAYTLADGMLNKKYLSNLNQFDIVPLEKSNPKLAEMEIGDNVRIFHISRIIYDQEENNQEKLLNVYSALHNCGGSVVLLVKSTETQMDFYIATKEQGVCKDILESALQGNFPGTNIKVMFGDKGKEIVSNIFDKNGAKKVISAVTSPANFREGHTMKSGDFVQGLEKLLETSRRKNFTLIVVANPISAEDLEKTRSGYEQLYTQLMPLAKSEINYGSNESQAISDSITDGITNTISNSVALSNSHSVSNGTSQSYAHSEGKTITDGTTKSVNAGVSGSIGSTISKAIGGSLNLGIGKIIGAAVGVATGGVGGVIASAIFEGLSAGVSKTINNSQKVVALNCALNNALYQSNKRDEIIKFAQNTLKSRYDISIFSEITERVEKFFAEVLPENRHLKSVKKSVK